MEQTSDWYRLTILETGAVACQTPFHQLLVLADVSGSSHTSSYKYPEKTKR